MCAFMTEHFLSSSNNVLLPGRQPHKYRCMVVSHLYGVHEIKKHFWQSKIWTLVLFQASKCAHSSHMTHLTLLFNLDL